MKKYILSLIIFLVGCTNIDKKEYYYSNSVKLDVIFNKSLKGFEKAYLKIFLWSEKDELLDEKTIYDISHKENNVNTKKILVNFKNYDKTKENKIAIELFADTDSDEIYENYSGILRVETEKQKYIFDVRWIGCMQ